MGRGRSWKTAIGVLVVLVALGLSVWLSIMTRHAFLRRAEKAEIYRMCVAVHEYFGYYTVYPVDDTDLTSRGLVRSLNIYGRKDTLIFEFEVDRLKDGEYVSHVGNPYRYRENFSKKVKTADMHNPDSFDLWTEDLEGRPDGFNNWEAGK